MPQANSNKTKQAPGKWILPTYGNTDCWKDYEPGIILGKGTFGTTYLATEKKTGDKYAVKVGAPAPPVRCPQAWGMGQLGQLGRGKWACPRVHATAHM